MRNLATIQKISKIEPIKGANNIVKATVLGWEVVIRKDEFKENDLVVYCEIDSIMPEKLEFEFLRNRKFRIKTAKFKGQVSQGICFSLDILPKSNYNLGDDVTDIIGIKKYDPQAEQESREIARNKKIQNTRLQKTLMKLGWFRKFYLKYFTKEKRLSFPALIPKTDEPRIQLFSEELKNILKNEFFVTEKLDGQSATYFLLKRKKLKFFNKTEYGVCSRRFRLLKEDDSTWHQISKKYHMRKILENILYDLNIKNNVLIYLQGEIVGPKVQDNKYNLKELDFYAFNLVIIDLEKHQIPIKFQHDIMSYILKEYNIKTVPFIKRGYFNDKTIPELVKFSRSNSTIKTDIPREGLVFKNDDIHFKVINPDFLLKYE